jgi:hypothetical protein
MARIRSIHPGLASDEIYMSMSMAAKAAWPLLWTECDDSGAFEWKPIVLKARIFPADNLDFAEILAEFVKLDCVRIEEVEGKPYGYIRNFGRYQRPKNPSFRFDISPAMAKFTGSKERHSAIATPAVPQPSPGPTEKESQRKEEGGRRDIGDNLPASVVEPARAPKAETEEMKLRVAICDAYRAAGAGVPPATGEVAVWLAQGFPADLCLSVIRSKLPAAKDKGLRWFDKAIAEAFAKCPQKPPDVGRKIDIGSMYPMPEDNLRRAVEKWRENPQSWAPQWGDPPDENPKIKRWLAENAGKKLEVA